MFSLQRFGYKFNDKIYDLKIHKKHFEQQNVHRILKENYDNKYSLKENNSNFQIPCGSRRPCIQNRAKHVTITGGIASGKSTILKSKEFQEDSECIVVTEDFDKWIPGLWHLPSSRFHLQALSSFQLQNSVERIYHALSNERDKFIVTERDAYTSQIVFTDWNNYGVAEYHTMTRMTNFMFIPDAVIYLQCDPEIVAPRVKARGRPFEVGLPLSYHQTLHERHEILMDTFRMHDIPVYTISNNTFENSHKKALKALHWLKNLEFKPQERDFTWSPLALARLQAIASTDDYNMCC